MRIDAGWGAKLAAPPLLPRMFGQIAITVDSLGPQQVIDVVLAPVTVLLAGTGFWSGLLAAIALLTRGDQGDLAAAVDRGVAIGFVITAPAAVAEFGVALSLQL